MRNPIFISICLSLLAATPAVGQIVPDATLPVNSLVTENGNITTITGGTTSGSYLFHSFQEFSIPTGGSAFFNNAPDTQNIITRITGGSISNIDGIISANGSANLFFLNPAGIVFGANAQLNIGGSFLATTATSIKWADGSEFSAADPTRDNGGVPLLTINVPLGLQLGSGSGSILVEGPGNNLSIDPETTGTIRDFRPSGLEVNPGQTLALIGGDITLNGGNLTAPSGTIELHAIASGEIVADSSTGQITINPPITPSGANIQLLQAASIDASGPGGGHIHLLGRRIELHDGAAILTDTLGDEPGGNLTLGATESVELTGINGDGTFFTGLFADVAPDATGAGGSLLVETGSLLMTEGAQIIAGSLGSGYGGELTVRANSVEIKGGGPDIPFPTGLFVSSVATGNGGQLTVEAENLLVTDGAQIVASTFGQGNAGNITLRANSFELDGISPTGEFVSGIFADVVAGATGNGGDIAIEAQSLRVTAGAQIIASTFGEGKAGDISVVANSVEVTGTSSLGPSGLFTSSTDIGAGGNLTLQADLMRLSEGAQIAAGTLGGGNGGTLAISARTIELTGSSSAGRTGLFASAVLGTGNGGDINVASDRLTVRDGALISASNFSSNNPNIPPGSGAAGNVNIRSQELLLDRGGTLTADTAGGDRGNISLAGSNIQMRRGSQITTNATGTATGGNILIDTETLSALENSDITANAEASFGGRVVISAQGIFGTAFRQDLTPGSDITASSQLGAEFSGTVEIKTPDADPSSGLVPLPDNAVDVESLVARNLCAQPKLAGSFFAITGRGGLPPNPTAPLTSTPETVDWSSAGRGSFQGEQGRRGAGEQRSRGDGGRGGFETLPYGRGGDTKEPIQEAQGLTVAADGTIWLTAEPVSPTPHAPRVANLQCQNESGSK